MKEETRDNLKLYIALSGIVFCSLIIGYSFNNAYSIIKNERLIEGNVLFGLDTDISTLGYDLNKDVQSFYKYNISHIFDKLSIDQLKEDGGVCWHYADYYVEKAKEQGVYAQRITIPTNDTFNHAFAVISNNNGYCLLDQVNIECIEFDNDWGVQ